jgi:hypothetical protein
MSSLPSCYFDCLPLMQSMGIPEVLRIKSVAYYTLLNRLESLDCGVAPMEEFQDEFPILLSVVSDIIHSEWVQVENSTVDHFHLLDPVPHMSMVTMNCYR